MKRYLGLFLALTTLLSLTACGTKTEPPKDAALPEQPDTAYAFAVSTDTYEDECTAEDGTALLRAHYERGERLLSLSTENYVLADYFEADKLWRCFDMTTMPLDSEDSVDVDGRTYYRVDYRELKTMDDLRALLLTRFDDSIVDELLAPFEGGAVHYRDVDGALYGIQCDRGSDISRGDATYAVELSGSGGKVIATVEELEWRYNGETEQYDETVTGHSTVEFPFVLTESGARFTHFESIW